MTNLQKLIECWKPIEEAPKDGETVFVWFEYAGGSQVLAVYYDNGELWDDSSKTELEGWWYNTNSVGSEKVTESMIPTHYMPLDTPEKLARIVGVLVKAIESAKTTATWDVLVDLTEALQQAEQIAGE